MPVCTLFLNKCSSSLILLLPLLASLKVICSVKRHSHSSESRISASLTPYPTFFSDKARKLSLLLILHSQLFRTWKPAELTFLPRLSRPPQEDALRIHEQYKSCVRALLVFHVPKGILVSLSLPLFSTLSFPQD